jgi:hypothetical protein
MIAIKDRRLSFTYSVIGVLLLLLAPASHAAFVFTDQNLDVTFSETGFSDITDNIVAGTGTEISYNDGSNIGGDYGLAPGPDKVGIMLDHEFIDFGDTTVTFNLRGDGPVHSTGGYQTTGFNADASYILSLIAADFSIGNVSIGSMTDMIGVTMGTEITFDAKNIYFNISTLGILETTPGLDIGTLTLNVEFVPIPAALPLMLSGLAGLFVVSRRRKLK